MLEASDLYGRDEEGHHQNVEGWFYAVKFSLKIFR